MASWGLLQGFGRGLSQSSELLARGMAEDREAERQRLREASAEARWKRQEQREDAREAKQDYRYAEQVKSQADALAQAQKNADRSYGLQERQLNETTAMRKTSQIESNLSGLFDASEKAESKITDRYVRLMGKEGLTASEYEKLNTDMQAEITANRNYYNDKVTQYTQSYGDKLNGTAFEYLLQMKPDVATGANAEAADPAATNAGSVDDRMAKIQSYLKATTSGQALTQVASDYQNRFVQPTIGQKAMNTGLLNPIPINQGLNVDDIGQFATFATGQSNGLLQRFTPKVK